MNAPQIIATHIHPSSDLLQIELLEHLVISERGFVSMWERKLGFAETLDVQAGAAAYGALVTGSSMVLTVSCIAVGVTRRSPV